MKSGYCTIIWNGRDHRASEMNHHQPLKASLHPKKVMLCIWWNWKGVLYIKPKNPNKYSSQLKAVLNKKCPELVNRKCIIFNQNNARWHVSLIIRKKLLQLGWEVLIIHHIHQILQLWMSIYFGFYKILLMEKVSKSLENCKTHL